MTVLTLPSYMSLQDWADQICLDLDTAGAIARLLDENAWQDWAIQFISLLALGRNLPNPYNFADWREWAERFCQTLA
jgi:hypothetical protein